MPLWKQAKRPNSLPKPIRRNNQRILSPKSPRLGSGETRYLGGIVAERHEVVFVDGVRTPFGRAGEKGMYWQTRADDLVVKAMTGLLDRNPNLPRERVDDV